MKNKLYKVLAIFVLANAALAKGASGQQVPPEPPVATPAPATPDVPVAPKGKEHINPAPLIEVNKDLLIKLKDIDVKIKNELIAVQEKLSKIEFHKMDLAMADLGKNFAERFKDFGKNFEGMHQFDLQYNFQGAQKTKIISKTYSVDRNDKLAINNQFGTVVITTWEKNEIKVDVEVKAFENSENSAQELLDNVTITDSKQPNLISFKTDIKRGSQSWHSTLKNGKEERRGVQVNYVVYMPAKNPLDITNKYGSTSVPDFDGELNVNSSYGSLTCKSLNNINTVIKSAYSSTNIESVKAATLDISYGNLKLGSAGRLNGDVRYGETTIGKLSGDGLVNVKYGSFKISQVDEQVKNLTINAAYNSVVLGFTPSAGFNFDVTVSYAGFAYDKGKVSLTSTEPPNDSKGFNPTKIYKGTYGKGSGARVIIKSSYNSVKFL